MRFERHILIYLVGLALLVTSQSEASPISTRKDITVSELGALTEAALEKRDFNELESTAEAIRSPDVRLLGGNSRIYHFYGALGAYAGAGMFGYSSQIPFEAKRKMLEQWLAAKPRSTAARIAIGQFWINYGWLARGDAYADKVTPEQWKLFTLGLDKADVYMKEVDPRVDPHGYYLLMLIAKGRPNPRSQLDALFNSAVRLYPGYFHYYSQRANIVLERWYGDRGEVKAYVNSVLHSPGGDDGQVAYSYIAFNLLSLYPSSTLYEATGLSWPIIRSAYATRERRFGLRNRDWNVLCYFAVAASDRKTALKILDRIGSNWDADVWQEQKYFDSAVKWIKYVPDKTLQPIGAASGAPGG